MERQTSFSIKAPIKVLFLWFSISFLTLFSVWILNSTSPFVRHHQQQEEEINPHSPTSFPENSSQDPILSKPHLRKPKNTTGFVEFSVSEKINSQKNESQVPLAALDNQVEANKSTTTVPESAKVETLSKQSESSSTNKVVTSTITTTTEAKRIVRSCDFTKGRWVYDDKNYPLYRNTKCPFIDEAFDCEGNGRLNIDYMYWRWQPYDCDLPRFNATKMLELMRGKRLVFVGDSINRNQWESMLCMLLQGVRDPNRVYETHRRKITKEKGNYSFKFLDYKCTVEYYVTHFLVHESKARVGKKRVSTLQIDTMDRGTSKWKGADILVFNSAHWWTHHKTQAGINYFQERDRVHPQLDVSTAFRKALLTWASWVDKNINARRSQIFFRSSSPSHFSGGEWNSGGHCREATQPLTQISSYSYVKKNVIVEDVVRQMRTPVTLLNFTVLSGYRIDGHPSIYGKRPRNSLSSGSSQDCSHWCLPGTPDTWNELLYYHLLSKRGILFQ